jgi:hypothetical protein
MIRCNLAEKAGKLFFFKLFLRDGGQGASVAAGRAVAAPPPEEWAPTAAGVLAAWRRLAPPCSVLRVRRLTQFEQVWGSQRE